MLIASRDNSVSPTTGGSLTLLYAVGAAVIGGTSLFGGKGRIVDAVIGGLVVAVIDNGMLLLNQPQGRVYIVTGVVLLLAASVDAIACRCGAPSVGAIAVMSRHGGGHVDRAFIDCPKLASAIERALPPASADDVFDQPPAFGRQADRPADEADADDRDALEPLHFDVRPSARSSAARKRSLCSGRPTVTRRCSGMP